MKKALITISILAALAGLGYLFFKAWMRSHILLTYIDWLAGTMQYKLSAGGHSIKGSASLTSGQRSELRGKYKFNVYPNGDAIVFSIIDAGTNQMIKGTTVDFANKTVEDLT